MISIITAGEPTGIGPDIIVSLNVQLEDALIIADADLLKARAKQLNVNCSINHWQRGPLKKNALNVLHTPCAVVPVPGILNPSNGQYVIQTLKIAYDLVLTEGFGSIVTAPVHKGLINDAGIPFTGHTEFFQDLCKVDKVVMMLSCKQMQVALLTAHVPIRKVPELITPENLEKTIRIVHQDLQQKFGIQTPRIAVLGLNPHAGESGYLGGEEIQIIEPCIRKLREQGIMLSDVLSADTAFRPEVAKKHDVYLAMYHDQGLIPIKQIGFGCSTNITLGLPIIRTSVDHGSALSIAGSGKANPSSLLYSLHCARQLMKNFNC